MGGHRTIFVLIAIMTAVALVIGGVTIGVLYDTAFEQRRAGLVQTARSQARLMEAMARHDQVYERGTPGGPAVATISQIEDAHGRYEGFGETGEFTLARREGDEIVFLLRHRLDGLDRPRPVAFDSPLAEPMRRALTGKSGTVVGLDYRGVTVLAAHEPVAVLNLGIVAKVDLAEVRAPFLRAGGIVFAIGFAIIAAGTALFFRVSNPMVRRLQKSEARLHTTLESVIEGVVAIDESGVIESFNQAAGRMFGYTAEEVIGRSVNMLMPETDSVQHSGYIGHYLETGEARMIGRPREVTGLRKDGTTFPLECGIAEMCFNGHRSFVATLRDITERKAAEAALRESEVRLRTTVRNLVEGIVTIDESGIIESFNPAAERMFGYAAEEAVGRNVKVLMPEPDRGKHDGYIRRYLETGEARVIGSHREVTGLRKDGTAFPLDFGVAEMRLGDRRFFAGTLHDITERKRGEEHLRQAQKMEAVGQLTAGVAHDFNNLLMVVIGNLELAEGFLGDNSGVSALVGRASAAAERGAALTHRLLAFSRKQALMPGIIDLNELVAGMTDLLRRTLGEIVEIETASADDLWRCEADPSQLENALLNLAINARDAMPKGGKLTVETGNVHLDDDYAAVQADVTPGQYVMVAVTDTGSGMPHEVIDRAFDPFFTTKEVGQGSGLGLSMIYGFVKQSGGHVTIYSEEGVGTTVKMYFPRSLAGAEEAQHEEHETAPRARGETILVVEDDPDVRALAVALLGDLGYEILEAADGETALTALDQTSRVNLLFTDVVLPGGMSGPNLAEEVKRRVPGVSVVFMSGYTDNAIIHQGRLDKGVELLNKPFRKADLAQKVRSVLDKANS